MGEKLVSVEKMLAKINEMEGNGQLIRPVARALREAMGEGPASPGEQFTLNVPILLQPETAIDLKTEGTKKELQTRLKEAMKWILQLKAEINDVHRAAKHFMGFEGSEIYTAGYLYVMLATIREQDAAGARAIVGKFFGLNETHTDNLSNDPSVIAKNLVNKWKEFYKDVDEVIGFLDFMLEESMIDGSEIACGHLSMLRLCLKLFKSTMGRHYAPGIAKDVE